MAQLSHTIAHIHLIVRILPTSRITRADTSCVETKLLFSKKIQKLGPLQEAIYRMIPLASCRLTEEGDTFICCIEPKAATKMSLGEIRLQFLDLVSDENLRVKVAQETEGIRNLILALAFGALAQQENPKSK